MTDFKTLLFRAGFMNFGKLNRKSACEFLLVSERTFERWLSQGTPCPRAIRMLETRIDGRVSNHPAWRDFRICREGYLWTPRGLRYEPEYINKIYVLQRTNRYHEGQAVILNAEIDHLRDLVGSRDKLREMGRDLLAISDRFKYKDALLKFELMEKDKTA
ncbi:hypothetical protein [Pseudoalteromonas xiamenensis]